MARIRKRGKNWEYEIKQNGKIVARGSGFSRKKMLKEMLEGLN